MAAFNRGLTTVLDSLLLPLRFVSPRIGLALLALVTAAVALVIIRMTSNQARIRRAKDGMYAALLEMRLFNDDLGAIWRAQADVLRFNGRYLGAALIPVLWMIVPLGLLVAHLDAFYGYRGLELGQPALVTAHVRPGFTLLPTSVTLRAPSGIRAEGPAVWFPSSQDLVWRIVPERITTGLLEISVGRDSVLKSVVVSNAVTRRSPVRSIAGWRQALENPSESPLPADGPFERVGIEYPRRELTLFGWPLPWLVEYGGLTLAFGFILGRLFGVEV